MKRKLTLEQRVANLENRIINESSDLKNKVTRWYIINTDMSNFTLNYDWLDYLKSMRRFNNEDAIEACAEDLGLFDIEDKEEIAEILAELASNTLRKTKWIPR